MNDDMDKIREVGESLLGTCKSADEIIQQVFGDEDLTVSDIDINLLYELDGITMQCDGCGWWFEPHELNDDQVCKDCE